MRALLIVIFLLGSLPIILSRPYVGVVMWDVVSFMNIQQEAWGALSSAPVGLMVAAAMLMGMIFTAESKSLPLEPIVVAIILFAAWVTVTTVLALRPDLSWQDWNKTIKMMLMTLAAIPLISNRQRLQGLVWAIVISVDIYGIRGGLFTLLSGGAGRVEGPPNTSLADNNALAVALIMVLPLLRYLQLQSEAFIVRMGLIGAMLITVASVFGSFSRGALIGIVAMLLWMIRTSRQRFAIIFLILLGGLVLVQVMPQSWFDRMSTISDASADSSVTGRYDAWTFAYRQALERPTGGGFHIYSDSRHFMDLVPTAARARSIHSIYFEALGEHGFIGLGIFLTLLFVCFAKASYLRVVTRRRPDQIWAYDLASMVQVSLIGYAVGGAFLELTFFDLFYSLAGLLVIVGCIIERERASEATSAAQQHAALSVMQP